MKHITKKTLLSKLGVAAVFGVTALTVLALNKQPASNNAELTVTQPAQQHQTQPPTAQTTPKIELVFALDTTGSMGGLIRAAKEKIWSIASTMAQAKHAPEIRIGLVAYRDRGDDYVTKTIALSDDIDRVYAALMDLEAAGGGDGPESVNEALYVAVNRISWSNDPNSYKVIFLVGDAPGHTDYMNDTPYTESIQHAKQRGIIINTIQAGQDPQTAMAWQQIASLAQGESFQVGQQGSAVAIATPFDDAIAETSKRLDKTRIYVGSGAEKEKQEARKRAAEKLYASAPNSVLARRAKYNATKSGKNNFVGSGELIQSLHDSKLRLTELDTEQLPEEMQRMTMAEREAYVNAKAVQRKDETKKLALLSQQRDAYIKDKLADGGNRSSLDEKIFSTLKNQAAAKGLDYSEAENDY